MTKQFVNTNQPEFKALSVRTKPGEKFSELLEQTLPQSLCNEAQQRISSWQKYEPTPLHKLDDLAKHLGVDTIYCKDEGYRFGLGSFKALGGAYAVELVAEQHGKGITVTCATEGNHGRSVAWGAQKAGVRCVIFLHEGVSESREQAIAKYGAEIMRVPGNYDDAVRKCAEVAKENNWQIVSDTTWEGYEEIPKQVMAGYSVIASEITDKITEAPSHVFIQAGVGGIATSVLRCLSEAWPSNNIHFTVVEPLSADCLYSSALAGGEYKSVSGPFKTLSAGLACGEPSAAVLDLIYEGINTYIAIDDRWITDAVRTLAKPLGNDNSIVAGVSGAAGLGGLLAALSSHELSGVMGLNNQSRILLLNTENATDPVVYSNIVDS